MMTTGNRTEDVHQRVTLELAPHKGHDRFKEGTGSSVQILE
ncbi:hypothetical protein K3495_g11884 [Podosphaera aphanis]|nr:hypothetical protein K3495_g11884 [Podosphaera aphanis]